MTDTKDRLAETLREHERRIPITLGLRSDEEHAWVQTTRDLLHQAANALADAAHDAQRAESGAGVPYGYTLVPCEPTEAMLSNFWAVANGQHPMDERHRELTKRQLARAKTAYRRLLAAAPEKDHG